MCDVESFRLPVQRFELRLYEYEHGQQLPPMFIFSITDLASWQGKNLWINIIHWWSKKECLELLDAESINRSPVAIALGRSGECNCGTMQSEADRIAASEFDPIWGIWLANLRKTVVRKFGWDIGQNPNKQMLAELKGQADLISDFLPMCVGCKAKQQRLFTV